MDATPRAEARGDRLRMILRYVAANPLCWLIIHDDFCSLVNYFELSHQSDIIPKRLDGRLLVAFYDYTTIS